MRKTILGAAGAIAVASLAAGAAWAHHSFGAEFDSNQPVTLEGEVAMFEWANPHSWIHIDIVNAEGEPERWRVEGGAPSALLRRGWNRNSLPPGTAITVTGFRSRDGDTRASAASISFPDGRELSLGNPGTAAAAAAAGIGDAED
jgi:hypothetical protein